MIKRILVISLAILLIGGIAFAAPITSPGIGDKMGQGKFPSDPHKTFRLVRYATASNGIGVDVQPALSVDSIVVWDIVSDDGVTVCYTATSGAANVAGIVVGAAIQTPEYGAAGATAVTDMGRRNWGWIQTYGYCEATVGALGAIATAGEPIGTSTTPGGIAGYNPISGATGAATLQAGGNAGFAFDAAAVNATDVEVFLKCE